MNASLVTRKKDTFFFFFKREKERAHLVWGSSGLVGHPAGGDWKNKGAPAPTGPWGSPGAAGWRELRPGPALTSVRSQGRPEGRHLGWKVSVFSFQHSRTRVKKLLGEQE